jgi:hypothetical protein
MAYNFDESSPANRHDSSISFMADQLASRSRAYNKEKGRQESQLARDQRDENLDWWSKAGKGAAIGSVGGGIGALAGAGIGAGIGIAGAYRERRKGGEGRLEALGKSIFNLDPLTSGRALDSVGRGVMGGIGAHRADKAQAALGAQSSNMLGSNEQMLADQLAAQQLEEARWKAGMGGKAAQPRWNHS